MQQNPQTRTDQALIMVPESAVREGPVPTAGTSDNAILAALRKHPLTAIAIFLGIFGMGVPLVIKLAKPLYYSYSVIYVSPTFSGTLKDDRGQRPQFDIQQKMLMIPRYDVVRKTIERLWTAGIDPRAAGESEQAAAERLGKAFEVTHVPDSYEISVGLRAADPKDLAEIVNCLTETFIETSKSVELYGEDSRIETLRGERTRLQTELDAALQSRSDIAKALGVVSFEQLPADKVLDRTRSDVDQAKRARVEAEAEVALLERDATIWQSSVPSGPRTDSVENARQQHLRDRRAEVERLIAPLRPQHPDYRPLESELKWINDQLKEVPVTQQAEARQPDGPAAQLLAKARIELERARKAESELGLELQRDIAGVNSTTGEFQRGRDLGMRIEQLRNQIGAIDERLSYFRLESASPGFMRVSSPARTPLVPEKSSAKKYLAGLFALALAASLGGVVLIDMTRSKISTVGDVERILGFPPLGVLLSPKAGVHAFAMEQFARMINNIERVHKRSAARVFVFTSVSPGAANTRLVNNIVRELQARHIRAVALGSGAVQHSTRVAETLVVSVSGGGAYDGTAATDRRGLGVFGVAHSRENSPMEETLRHSVTRFKNAIDEMLLDHELIVVDAPPLLLSADTEYLATLAGVTFLTVEAGVVSMQELKRAAALMEKLRPSGIGAILHGVSLKSSDSHLRRSFREFEACRKSV